MRVRQTPQNNLQQAVVLQYRIVEEKDFPLLKEMFRRSMLFCNMLGMKFEDLFVRFDNSTDFCLNLDPKDVKEVEGEFNIPTRRLSVATSRTIGGMTLFCFDHNIPWYKIEFLIDELKNIYSGNDKELDQSAWAIDYQRALGLFS